MAGVATQKSERSTGISWSDRCQANQVSGAFKYPPKNEHGLGPGGLGL